MVQFNQKRNFVRVLARDGAEHAERGGHRVAPTLDGELDDVLRIEVFGIRREAGAGGMFDSLVHRQDGQITSAGQPPMIEKLGQAAQHRRRAVGLRINPVHEIRSGQVQFFPGNGFAMMFQQTFSVVTQQLFKFSVHNIYLS